MRARILYSLFLSFGFLAIGMSAGISSASTSPSASHHGNAWKPEPEDSLPWPREPFKKLDTLKPQQKLSGSPMISPDITIQGIMKVDKHFYALINGRAVKTGDRIDELTIVNIYRDRIIVRRDKELQTYDIYQGRINRGTK
jgi:hypothetical protein